MPKLHQQKIHRYLLNKDENVIIHKFFDIEQVEKDKKRKEVKPGKWVSRGTIPAGPSSNYCKCDGQIWIVKELPEIYGSWGICSKCGREWSRH